MGDPQASKMFDVSREVTNWTIPAAAEAEPTSILDYEADGQWSAFPTISSSPSNSTGNVSVENGTASSNYARDEELAKVEMAVLALLFILTVLGNCIVLLGIFFRRQKMTRMYYFILHLSVADLITAFFNVLTQLFWEITYRFQGGNVLCKFVKYTQILGPYSSSYVLIMTAVDRYQAICYPLSNCTWTAKRSKVMLGLAWAISLFFCIPQIFIFSYQQVSKDPQEFDCWATFPEHWGAKAYVTWYSITVFIIPLIILVFAYSCITRAIWINFNMKTANNRNHDNFERRMTRQDSDEGDAPSHFEHSLDESVFHRDGQLSLRSNASHPIPANAATKKSLNINLYNPSRRLLTTKSLSTSSSASTSSVKKKCNESNKRSGVNNRSMPSRISKSTCSSQSSTLSPSLSGHPMAAAADKGLVGSSEHEKNSIYLNSQKLFASSNRPGAETCVSITTTSFTSAEAQEDEEQLHLIASVAERNEARHITPPPRILHSSSEKSDFEGSGAGSTHMKNGSVKFPGAAGECQHGCYRKRCNFCHLSSDDRQDERRYLTEDGSNNKSVLKGEELISETGGQGLFRKHSSNSPSPTSVTARDYTDKERDQSYRFSSKSSSRHLLLPGKYRFSKKGARGGGSNGRGSISGSSLGQQDGKQSVKSSVATYVNQQPRTHSVKGISRAKIKTIKLTVTIICCYIFCSSPFIAAQLWSVYDPYAYSSSFFTGPTFTILTLLASLNSCVNPYIFLFFNPNLLQNCFRGIFRPKFPVRRFNNANGSRLSRTMSHNKHAHLSVAGSTAKNRKSSGGNGNGIANHRMERSPNLSSSATSSHLTPSPLISHEGEQHRSHQQHHQVSINNGFEKGYLEKFSERNEAGMNVVQLVPQSSLSTTVPTKNY